MIKEGKKGRINLFYFYLFKIQLKQKFICYGLLDNDICQN